MMKLRSLKTIKTFHQKSTKSIQNMNDKWANLQQILDRGGPQVGETELSFQVLGVYSLPEQWGKLQSSGSVDAWNYVVKFSDGIIEGGKYNFRELTEEEKKEQGDKKKAPPKPNKKDPAAQKAEEERLAKEKKEKEEKEKEFQDMLDKMSPEDQFYYLKEMPTKEAWVSFPDNQSYTTVKKQAEKFIELEQDVNVCKGAILEVQFIPPIDEDVKKRPKPKGINPEDVKPIYCVSWIDLSKLHSTPGLNELKLRANLLTKEVYEKRIDEYEAKTGKKVLNPNDEEIVKIIMENEEENRDYVEKSKSYIYINIVLSNPVNPLLPDIDLPEPLNLLKKEPAPKKPITNQEIEDELIHQFKIAIAAIAKSYDEAMGDSEKGQLVRREKGNSVAGNNQKKEEKESNIYKFLDKFNTSGRADLLKEKLKKFIIKIVREIYDKKKESVKGVYRDKRDQFYSELYAYLTDKVKQATNELVKVKMDELHENILVSFGQSHKEIMNYIQSSNDEKEDKRLLRLSKENELLEDYNKAVKYYKSKLIHDSSKEAWMSYANLAKKLEDLPEVENALTNAISTDLEAVDLNIQIIFCGLLYLKGQIQNAINYMNLFLLKKGLSETDHVFNAFYSFLCKEKNTQSNLISNKNSNKFINANNAVNYDALSKKHFEAAKFFKIKTLPPEALKPKVEEVVEEEVEDDKKKKDKAKKKDEKPEPTPQELEELGKKGNPRINPLYKPPVLNEEQIDQIWFDTMFLFKKHNFFEINEKLMTNISEASKEKPEFKIEIAKILLYRKDYDKCIEACDDILLKNEFSYDAYLTKANALFHQKKYPQAEESYIKAIRFKPQEISFDQEMLVQLGKLYINESKWYDAKVVFKQILRENPEHSFAWRYLGYALTKLKEFSEAEEALKKANLLDVENPLVWAYLTIFCLSTKKINQAIECLNELNKVNYCDEVIMKEIAEMLEALEQDEIAVNIYVKIKNVQRKNDSYYYLKLAKIYYDKMKNQDLALKVLKEGLNSVYDDEEKEKLNSMIKDIQDEQERDFVGIDKEIVIQMQ